MTDKERTEERTKTNACDLIKRQDAIDTVNSIDNLDAKARGGIVINLMGLPSAEPEVLACGNGELVATEETDMISRRAAIDALRTMQTYKMTAGDDLLLIDQAGAMTELMLLPPAEPEREYTMEEFMYGQDMGNPEDGSL